MKNSNALTQVLSPALLLAALAAGNAHAGRPLTVDDANVNDTGKGHVEAWYARQPGKANTWTVSPAYAPVDGLEIGAALSRDTSARETSTAVQLKWRITPSQENGCNLGAVGGVSHTRGSGSAPYVNGLVTCNGGFGAVHLNLGALRPSGGPSTSTWGVAYERELGAVTAHAELFGERHGRPTFQVGLRTEVAAGWQLDGTVGRDRGARETVYSIGLKRSF